MATLHENKSQNIHLVEKADTIIFDKKILGDGSVQSSGEYRISDEVVDGNETVLLTSPDNGHHQDLNLVIMDNKGMILLDGKYTKRKCFRKVLHICSPAGFFLGSFREKHFKCRADYEIHGPNETALFRLTVENNSTEFSIEITPSNGGQMIAKVSSLAMKKGKVRFTLTYYKNISTLQKSLILCAAVSCCEQEYNAYKLKCCICNTLENRLCCPLFKERKIQVIIMIILFPLIITGCIFALGLTIISFGCYVVGLGEVGCECMFCWPCWLCGMTTSCFRCSFPDCMR